LRTICFGAHEILLARKDPSFDGISAPKVRREFAVWITKPNGCKKLIKTCELNKQQTQISMVSRVNR
jgi:hypothetical protein